MSCIQTFAPGPALGAAESHSGRGLDNMRRRAQQHRVQLHLEAIESGMKVTLLLPSCPPDFEETAV